MKSICIISDGYPYGESNHCVFVRELVMELANCGIACTVITPQMKGKHNYRILPYEWVDEDNNNPVKVYAPKYTAFSSKPFLMKLTMISHKMAVNRVLKKHHIDVDAFYGHFIYLNGLTAIMIAQKRQKKSLIACGENSNRLNRNSIPYGVGLKYHRWSKILSLVNGVICVSNENEKLLHNNGFINEKVSTIVIPNAVNTNVFKPLDRIKARKKFSLSPDDFVIAFVGAFIQRKGNQRVDEAALGIDNVKTIFIGQGNFTPKSDCVFCGTVNHDELPEYLAAADVFVLPTTGEGCCNAIIEAICCGLPVISSKGAFNDDILDNSYSMRIDPNSVQEIRTAILQLKQDVEMQSRMRDNALLASKRFSLTHRAEQIIKYMENV